MNLAEHIESLNVAIRIERDHFLYIEVGDFLYTFSSDYSNYRSANDLPYIFDSLEGVTCYLSMSGHLLDIYNEWLKHIGNTEYECEDFSEAFNICIVLEVVCVTHDSLDVKVHKL